MASLIRATALLDLPAILLEAGVDPGPALRLADIDPKVITLPDMMIPADRVAWLLDALAERYGLADLAIRLAFRRRLANIGVAGLVLMQQPTVREALSVAERYRHLLSDALGLHVDDADGMAVVTVSLAISASSPGRQARELGLAACVHVFRLLLGSQWAPDAVYLSHPPPTGGTLHRRFFGCPVLFDSPFDGIACTAAELDRPVADADMNLAAYSAGLLDRLPAHDARPTTGVVSRLIHALLPMGRASIDSVARAMNRNVRTLQRDLRAEGTVFKTLLSEIRVRLALGHLSSGDLSVDEVSARLGYASPSAFIRFFRERFGVAPGAWRDRADP